MIAAISLLAAAGLVAAADGRMLIFILAGQSNMSGRGGVEGARWDGVVPPECRPSPEILRFSSTRRWEVAREPLHADIDVNKTCGVGPGMAFANSVLAGEGGAPAVIGLVPCAVGGTTIEDWERGGSLYEQMVERARAAAAMAGDASEVAAVLWYQGESDTVDATDAAGYGRRMTKLVRDVRSDLGLPNLLFIQVAIASGEGKFISMVRGSQEAMRLPNVVCVDAKGLPLEDDHLHLTTQAQVLLGNMLAQAYLAHGISCPVPFCNSYNSNVLQISREMSWSTIQ